MTTGAGWSGPKAFEDRIFSALEEVFGLAREELAGPSRSAYTAWARQVGMTALMDYYHYSPDRAASAFGKKHRSTATHAKKTVLSSVEVDWTRRRQFGEVCAKLEKADLGDKGASEGDPETCVLKMRLKAADGMARAIDRAVKNGYLSSRSAIVNARLGYGEVDL